MQQLLDISAHRHLWAILQVVRGTTVIDESQPRQEKHIHICCIEAAKCLYMRSAHSHDSTTDNNNT